MYEGHCYELGGVGWDIREESGERRLERVLYCYRRMGRRAMEAERRR